MQQAARERARYYAASYGSADAALSAVDQPGYNDAFDRAVCQELRTLRHDEWKAANAAAQVQAPRAAA